MSNDVTYTRDEYDNALAAWTLVDDVCAGQAAIKAKKTTYLPQPNELDTSPENQNRYKQYVARAVFYNATGRTLQGLVGAVFRKVPELQAPAMLEYVANDIDGAGISIYQQSQECVRAVLKRGRHALLADYPATTAPVSVADMNAGLVRATVASIDAAQVINWRTTKVGAAHLLSLVVISECADQVTADGFGAESIPQYRVLKLIDGIYTVEIWRQDEKKNWLIFDTYTPLNGRGRAWGEIPFTFIGANNNDTSVDPAPLYDLSEINVAHYRNSADYEDSAYFCGQVQPWISGLTEAWRDHLEKAGIYVGSRAPMLLPEGGAFGYAQAQPNTLCKEAMDQKEEQMKALGARLLTRGTAVKTATESQGEQEAEHSVLSLVCSNVSEAYTKVLGWMLQFMNTTGTAEFKLNQDFVESRLEAQMLTALIGAWQSGQLPESDLWSQLREYGLIDPEKTDEQIREELDTQAAGLGLDKVGANANAGA